MTDTHVDLVVLGGGSGGYAAALRAAGVGFAFVQIFVPGNWPMRWHLRGLLGRHSVLPLPNTCTHLWNSCSNSRGLATASLLTRQK